MGFDTHFVSSVDDLVENARKLLVDLRNEPVNSSKRQHPEYSSKQSSKKRSEPYAKKKRADDVVDSFSASSTNTGIGLDRGDVAEDTTNTQESPAISNSLVSVTENRTAQYPTRKSRILSRFLQFQLAPQTSVKGQEESFASTYQI
ncbi:hypothetical protein [Legionella tunisiensis]|uniref:hypothetical protein n=1 Tax=Legionella tunisiensis TaxID=1034944 RepID=UPI0002D94EB4|nr:hypothetical protein [Legionella tunisiensis]